jgi:hypothetical protein
MGIKAPGLLTFGVSVLLTLAVLVSKVGVAVPLVSGYEFLVLLVAQILLILGCTIRGAKPALIFIHYVRIVVRGSLGRALLNNSQRQPRLRAATNPSAIGSPQCAVLSRGTRRSGYTGARAVSFALPNSVRQALEVDDLGKTQIPLT